MAVKEDLADTKVYTSRRKGPDPVTRGKKLSLIDLVFCSGDSEFLYFGRSRFTLVSVRLKSCNMRASVGGGCLSLYEFEIGFSYSKKSDYESRIHRALSGRNLLSLEYG